MGMNINLVQKTLKLKLKMHNIGIISTLPPTQCGIATYASDLIQSLSDYSPELIISKFELTHLQEKEENLEFLIRNNQTVDYFKACEFINSSNIELVDIQHEFKIFGAPDGENLNILLDNLKKPITTTLHTISPNLSEKREKIFINILKRSDLIFLFSFEAKDYIIQKYKIKSSKIIVIPHGTPEVKFHLPEENCKRAFYPGEIILISTGHMRDSKGYDMALQALNILRHENLDFHYLIIGANHPANETASTYRNNLIGLVNEFGLNNKVSFIDNYLPLKDLIEYIQLADVCLLPYMRKEQSSSGVLALMVACGRPVVSTPFQYAISQVSNKSGIISESFSSIDFSNAIKSLIKQKQYWREMMHYNYNIGKSWRWMNVAEQYILGFKKIIKNGK
jgi:polysaccharide biosynthesis protein PslF